MMERDRGKIMRYWKVRLERTHTLKCYECTFVVLTRHANCSQEQPYPRHIGVSHDHFVQNLQRAGDVTVSKSYLRTHHLCFFFAVKQILRRFERPFAFGWLARTGRLGSKGQHWGGRP